MTIEASDILSDGYVRMYRQRTDIPFIPDNILNIETTFQSLPRLHAAFTNTAKKEAELSAERRYYKVRSGDYLGLIAKRNYTTVSAICRLNGIKADAVLPIGKVLRVK